MAEAQVQAGTQTRQVNDDAGVHQAALSIVNEVWGKKEAKPEVKAEPKSEVKPEPKVEEKPAVKEEPEKETPEVAETKEETPEIQEEVKPSRKLKLKYKGEELEKDEDEVISLAQQGFDYTQKSQALSKERGELSEKIKSSIDPVIKDYSARLQIMEKALWNALAPEVNNTDWNALAKDNPGEWAQRMQAVTNVNNILAAIQKEQAAIAARTGEEQRSAHQKRVAEAKEALERDVPGWGDDLYQKILKAGVDYGYKPEEIGAVTDPTFIKVLNDARKYRELQKAKPAVEKRVAEVPKVIKPGTADKPDSKNEKYKQAMTDLRKTGRDDEAVRVAKMILG